MFNIKEHDFGLISPFILINSIELFAEVFSEYVFWVLNGWHFVCRYGIYWTRLDADRVIFVRGLDVKFPYCSVKVLQTCSRGKRLRK